MDRRLLGSRTAAKCGVGSCALGAAWESLCSGRRILARRGRGHPASACPASRYIAASAAGNCRYRTAPATPGSGVRAPVSPSRVGPGILGVEPRSLHLGGGALRAPAAQSGGVGCPALGSSRQFVRFRRGPLALACGGAIKSELRRAGRACERNHIANVGDSRDKHQHPLETEAEAGVRHAAVATKVEIPPVVLLVEFMAGHVLA